MVLIAVIAVKLIESSCSCSIASTCSYTNTTGPAFPGPEKVIHIRREPSSADILYGPILHPPAIGGRFKMFIVPSGEKSRCKTFKAQKNIQKYICWFEVLMPL
jgi:hypothetical protein